MKYLKIAFYTILIILIMRYIVSPAADAGNFPEDVHVTEHVCIDKTHETCDGECVCDGMECNN